MTIERERSEEAFQKLDPGDIDAAIELGSDICKELGICCTEKGRVMFQVFKRLREQKAQEAAAAPPEPAPVEPVPSSQGSLEVLKENTQEGGE
ncbi:hypothetical protein ES705_31899 [subsurface metagenome]